MIPSTIIVFLLTAALLGFNIASPTRRRDGDNNTSIGQMTRATLVNQIARQLQGSRNVSVNVENHTQFSTKDIKVLFKKLLFQNCSHASLFASCNLCVTPDEVMKWHGLVSEHLSENELVDMSAGIVYILSEYVDHNVNERDIGDVCKTFNMHLFRRNASHVFDLFINKYGARGALTDNSYEKIIGNINKTYGYRLTEKECFTTHDGVSIFNGTRISDEAELKRMTMLIITKLLSKGCIEHGEEHIALFDVGKVFYRFDRLYLRTLLHKLSEVAEAVTNQQGACFNATKEHLVHQLSLIHGSVISKGELHQFAQSFIHVTRSECHKDDDHDNHDDDDDDHDEHDDHDDDKHDEHDGHEEHDEHDDEHDEHDDHDKKDTWEPWIGSLVSISIISLASLAGIFTVSGRKRKYFEHCMTFLMALGVSVMICDAILHLIPHSFGLHGHGNDDDEHKGHGDEEKEHEDPFGPDSYLWKCFAVLMGVYVFLVFEFVMAAFTDGHGHSHSHSHSHSHDATPHVNDTIQEEKTRVEMNGVVLVNAAGVENGDVTIQGDDVISMSAKKRFSFKSLNTVSWMILIGDGIHNFMDGIAIGGAFSEPFPAGLQGGVMTSIAIFIHEVPHELADFAILVSTGLSVKQALCLNLLSSFTAFAGGIVGLILGTQWNATPWILAITAGLFIYVAMATMLPEVLQHPLLKTSRVAAFLLDICGLAVGLIIMILLAGYEEELKMALMD